MTAIAAEDQRLDGTDGFVVESPEGDVGRVEEVWVGEANEPRALAVRTSEGRHGLLLGENVLAVDRENRWVIVSPETVLLELDTPRLQTTHGEDGGSKPAASWTTTGDVVPLAPPHRHGWRFPTRLWASVSRRAGDARLPQAVAMLLTSIVLLVALVMTLAFIVARLVTGAAY